MLLKNIRFFTVVTFCWRFILSSCKRGTMPVLVLSLLGTYDQNIFGLLFHWIPIFRSNSLFDLRIIALTLFLALVYACQTFSAFEALKTWIMNFSVQLDNTSCFLILLKSVLWSLFRLRVIQIAMIFKGNNTMVALIEWSMTFNIQYFYNFIS